MPASDPLALFVEAACIPIGPGNAAHNSGDLADAEKILLEYPDLTAHDLCVAAILGDDTGMQHLLAQDPGQATRKLGPRNWDPLTYLCFSRYLRLDKSRSEGFARAATVLLAAGADPNTGFFESEHQPRPEWESVLYGAAGIAQHPGLTQLLLDHGADPNDGEVTYHSPETYDNTTLKVLLDSKRLSADSLSTMLLRKADFHDRDGMQLLLEAGADPNRMTLWGYTALHQSLRRDNSFGHIELLLDHGADPLVRTRREGFSSVSIAIHRGRAVALKAFQQRGFLPDHITPAAGSPFTPASPATPAAGSPFTPGLEGPEQLLYACAMDDTKAVTEIATQQPAWAAALRIHGGTLLAEFAGTANAGGVAQLLSLGIPVTSLYNGDGYYGIPKDSTALHVAAWKAWPEVVQLLIDSGAPIDATDGNGRTPLQLAIRASVDSYWTNRRQPTSVHSLLQAGASLKNIVIPCGYEEVDLLLRAAADARRQ